MWDDNSMDIPRELDCLVKADPQLKALINESVDTESHVGLRGTIFGLPNLKKFFIRFGGEDEHPRDLTDLVQACLVMEV
jgi:hypothetical protein